MVRGLYPVPQALESMACDRRYKTNIYKFVQRRFVQHRSQALLKRKRSTTSAEEIYHIRGRDRMCYLAVLKRPNKRPASLCYNNRP